MILYIFNTGTDNNMNQITEWRKIPMALIKCPECGREVSDKANSCPNCGMPIAMTPNNKTSNNKMTIWNVVSIVFFSICIIRFFVKSCSGLALALDYKVEKGYLYLYLCMCSFTFLSVVVSFLLFFKRNKVFNTLLLVIGGFHILLFVLYVIRIFMIFPEDWILLLMAFIENGGLAALFVWECVKRKRNEKGKNNIPYYYAAVYFASSILSLILLSLFIGFAGTTAAQNVLIWPYNYFKNFNLSASIMCVIIVVSGIPLIRAKNNS